MISIKYIQDIRKDQIYLKENDIIRIRNKISLKMIRDLI